MVVGLISLVSISVIGEVFDIGVISLVSISFISEILDVGLISVVRTPALMRYWLFACIMC